MSRTHPLMRNPNLCFMVLKQVFYEVRQAYGCDNTSCSDECSTHESEIIEATDPLA